MVQSVSLVVAGVGLGVGISYAFLSEAPETRSFADSSLISGDAIGAPSGPAPIAVAPTEIDPGVLRFAWGSTCQVAVEAVRHGSVADIEVALRTAHDQAALFGPGIVPDDVEVVLQDAYDVTVLKTGGVAPGASGESPGLGGRISESCDAWLARIDAAG